MSDKYREMAWRIDDSWGGITYEQNSCGYIDAVAAALRRVADEKDAEYAGLVEAARWAGKAIDDLLDGYRPNTGELRKFRRVLSARDG